ncbi:uncharacterized protein [Antedon mediterranea]|uniref:uncharacterized protein n=1 Tax=Antedon mediterranea TaxID=105859 RepID=UPI003AF4DF2A
MERDDNSRIMPGKRDACKTSSTKEKRQIRYLNDYMMNLFAKYKSENPEQRKVSFSSFKKIRQRNANIKLVKFTARNTSLCQKHQNFALQLKVLKSLGVITITSPDEAIKSITDTQISDLAKRIPDQEIQYEEWKRVPDNFGKKKTKLVQQRVDKSPFADLFVTTTIGFRKHAQRVTAQYTAIRECKENLQEGECVIHMDFAQNYTCVPMEEVQSAYWNQTGVTLHPIVAYFHDGEIKHHSMVAVSDTRAHNASTVFAILKKLVPKLRGILPELKTIHYWTDSPTSQYRNKTIFSIISNHNILFHNINASWDYFEAGHGKGPCDGIGGTVKRLADEAVKRGAAVIQDAHDFFAWACQERENSRIEYFFVTNEECVAAESEIQMKWPNIRPVPGTTNLHAVRGISGEVMVRNVSCYCGACQETSSADNMCPGWIVHSLTKRQKQNTKQSSKIQFHVDDWVSALYDEEWYIGKVVDIDDEDALVSFLKSGSRINKNIFQWPNSKDENMDFSAVLKLKQRVVRVDCSTFQTRRGNG